MTLPPVISTWQAPIGDAGLTHSMIVPMYLPALDEQNLLAFYAQLTLPYGRHPAEMVLRTLLSHEGNARVRPLGGHVTLSLSGANPVEVSGGNCTVNLSANALQLSQRDLYTAALAIAATLCELEDIHHVSILVAGTPVAMDVSGCLPLGTLSSQLGQELPVLWEQLAARRTPVGSQVSQTPLTAASTLYFPLADGSGITAEVRRLTFPGQDPQQLTQVLLSALSSGAVSAPSAADMPDLSALLLAPPEVTELDSGGKRVTLRFPQDVKEQIAVHCDPACCFAALVYTLTTFVPSLQQVCILVGNGALTSLYGEALGSILFPGGLHTRAAYAHALLTQATIFVPEDGMLAAQSVFLPYRNANSPRTLLPLLSGTALPAGLTDADILGLSVTGDTLLINLSVRYAEEIRRSTMDQRLSAYAVVSTMCHALDVKRVRFFFGSEAADSLDGSILWSGEFIHNPGLIRP